MGRTMTLHFFRAVTLLLALAFSAHVAHAQWSEAQRDEFYRDCLNACEKNEKVPAAQKAQCKGYCICVMEGAEKIEPKYDVLNGDFLANRDTDRVKSVKGLVPACNKGAFSPR